ncbi:TetR/AcrR family transcriptional regulator [Nonomuraea sp. NPDC026600]|uniref:TetR/AcrR family transcriptional regulator n=1 Tax=Nonomuraea sp. NPDC026600 TaxID=3155363 RepID=UPI0033DD52EE
MSRGSGCTAPPPRRIGRRERKKLATTAAIRNAALTLALRDGVDNVTIEQIADEADIHLRTFFNHFSSKEEAMMATAAIGAEALVEEYRNRPHTESVLQALREAVLVVMDQSHATSHEHIEALRLVRGTPSLLPQQLAVLAAQEKALAEAITERVGLGVPPPGTPTPEPSDEPAKPSPVYPAVCAAAALATLRVAIDHWLDRTTPRTPATQVVDGLRADIDQAIATLATGLDWPTPPAIDQHPGSPRA